MTKRRWRQYETRGGRRPVKDFFDGLSAPDRQEILAAMRIIRDEGTRAARHLRGDIYEVRVPSQDKTFRILFAEEGRQSQVLLALDAFAKKSRKTPLRLIERAGARLADWRERGRP